MGRSGGGGHSQQLTRQIQIQILSVTPTGRCRSQSATKNNTKQHDKNKTKTTQKRQQKQQDTCRQKPPLVSDKTLFFLSLLLARGVGLSDVRMVVPEGRSAAAAGPRNLGHTRPNAVVVAAFFRESPYRPATTLAPPAAATRPPATRVAGRAHAPGGGGGGRRSCCRRSQSRTPVHLPAVRPCVIG